MKNKRFLKTIEYILVLVLIVMSCPGLETASAAKKPKTPKTPKTQSATLRIVSTTDLHGQVSTTHYDTGSEKPGSVAQVYTLIKQARKEVGAANTVTLDTGDSVYGYAADYILQHSGEDVVQPIYKAMSTVGYDAITLGNHDFDYGYEYIDKQLSLSGLKSKCVLSNVILTDTGKTPWNETMVITKKVKTNTGKKVNVKIGLIGVTLPAMSSYSDCKEDLAPLPIVKTVQTEAAALKGQGVDFVVVLAHTSFGTENPAKDADNALYAITKLADVDAVAGGHGHKNWPSQDENVQSYYKYANVDKATGLMNGKPVTMVKDHAAGIGVMDLKLKITSTGAISLVKSSAELRMVNSSVASSKAILATQQAEIQAVDQSLDTAVASLGEGQQVNSYFALLEDNYAIQLANESKIQYGLSFTGGKGKNLYGDYPVVAVTKYNLYNNSATDQISLDGTITMKDILNMQQDNHNNNILYWVTGAQLREWLEWSASIYATTGGSIRSDAMLGTLLDRYGASSIVDGNWLEDWSAFCVFDGIEYTIDATQAPRYTKAGNLKDANAHRIVSMTCNGQPVADDQKFILVSNSISANIEANRDISEQKVLGKTDLAYQHLAQYIREQEACGCLTVDADNNWKVCFDGGSQYVVRTSALSQSEAPMKQWFKQLLRSNETFAYYLAEFAAVQEEIDTEKPLLVVASTQTGATDGPIDIKVQARDISGISQIKWLPGQVPLGDVQWDMAQPLSGGAFTVGENGIYSVLAADTYGNTVVKFIQISNLDQSVVPVPVINKVTNRTSILTGTARAGLTVNINAGGNLYTAEAAEDGTFSCTVERMSAGAEVSAYCSDLSGRISQTVFTTVIKNGPNVPHIDEISNKSTTVTGTFSDATTSIVAIVGTKVYCAGEQSKEDYKKSSAYKSERTIKTVDYVQTGNSFSFSVPTQTAGTTVKFVAIDKAGRTSSTVPMETSELGPDIPKLQVITDVEDYIYGRVTSVGEQGVLTLTVGNEQFSGAIAADGTFAVQTHGFLAGQQVVAIASDVKDGMMRTSLPVTTTVSSYQEYTGTNAAIVDDIYAVDTEVRGEILGGTCQLYMMLHGRSIQIPVDGNGAFVYALPEALTAGDSIYFIVRENGKLLGVLEKTVQQERILMPETPIVLTTEVTTNTTQLDVLTKEPGILVVNLNGVNYTYTENVYNEVYGGYVYTVPLPLAQEQQTILIYLINDQGNMSNYCTVTRTMNENEETLP